MIAAQRITSAKNILALFGLLGCLLLLAGLTAGSSSQDPSGRYPEPRYPPVPIFRSPDDLLPYARAVLGRAVPYTGNQRPGYRIRGGEKVLWVIHSYTDPWVVEAFSQAFREANCRLDVVLLQGPAAPWDSADALELIVNRRERSPLWDLTFPNWVPKIVKEGKYDFAIGATYLNECHIVQSSWYGYDNGFDWPTREMLGDGAVLYPEKVLEAIDRKAWEVIRFANEVRIADPEGTDLSFHYWDDYWQIVEGTHPTFKVRGSGIGPGQSEVPQISSHLNALPRYVLPKSDATGVLAGTVDHIGPYPRVVARLKNNKVQTIEGGGRFGDLWRAYLEKTREIKYPHSPGPGCDWLMEGALGSHPHIARPFNVLESAGARSGWPYDRNRSGVLHFGIGQGQDTRWAEDQDLPSSHFHIHNYFPTYDAVLRDGRRARMIDRGHLVALDDPGVRQIASAHGDPDQLLREAWIPGIAGINRPGRYEEYAKDPAAWFKAEHRRVYARELGFEP